MASDLGKRRIAPRPVGTLSGKRTVCLRVLSRALAGINRWLDRMPLTHWLHRRVRSRLEMSELKLPVRSGDELLSGLRIAFITDVHAGSFLDQADITEVCRQVQAQQPDLVLFGGDMINTRDREVMLFRQGLRELKPRYGMFAVLWHVGAGPNEHSLRRTTRAQRTVAACLMSVNNKTKQKLDPCQGCWRRRSCITAKVCLRKGHIASPRVLRHRNAWNCADTTWRLPPV